MDTDSFVIHIVTEAFTKTLLLMLKNGLTNQTTAKMRIDRFQ